MHSVGKTVRPKQRYQGHGDDFTVTVVRRESPVVRREEQIPGYWRCESSDGSSIWIAGTSLLDPTLYKRV